MLYRRTIAVVIPAWNEAAHISRVISTVPSFVDHIVVVDDASSDDTVVRARTTRDDRLVVLTHASNAGVGAAIVTGYRFAFAQGADVAAVMAGDGQMDPADLRPLLESVAGGADYAKGNRLVWPRVWRDMPKKRLAGNMALSWLTRRVTGLTIRDSQCGFTAITREAAGGIELSDLWPRYGYPNDLLARLVRSGASIVEVPVRAVYEDEQSGVTWRDALYVVPVVLARAWLRRFRTEAPVDQEPGPPPSWSTTEVRRAEALERAV